MNLIEAILLGIIQGLTEFLPVSSSGHLEIGKFLFDIDPESSLSFSIAVHGATVLSTIIVFWKELSGLSAGVLKFRLNDETHYVLKIMVSIFPVAIVGVFFKERIELFFNGNMVFIGVMLLVTACMLFLGSYLRKGKREIGYFDALIIGIVQAFAVLPGISRSGATISAGLMIGNKKQDLAKFSFLMVLIPVIGANLFEMFSGDFTGSGSVSLLALIAGFISAFITGYFACRWMINIVRRSKLAWFAFYCLIIGLITIILGT
jgi:undecaprenyl-diphosphatase